MTAYQHPYLGMSMPRTYTMRHLSRPSNKRLALQMAHPAESPAKKKKWTADEDASIIELRGNGMKWKDISERLGRSILSCRLRFQNYLEPRLEDKEKLALLYERFKNEMWEMIAKEMQLPRQTVEAIWQIREGEMAQGTNSSMPHLQQLHRGSSHACHLHEARPHHLQYQHKPRSSSTSPALASYDGAAMLYTPTHDHTLLHLSYPLSQCPRQGADSAWTLLPPLNDITALPISSWQSLPPILPDAGRR